jgi:hypothetical protein
VIGQEAEGLARRYGMDPELVVPELERAEALWQSGCAAGRRATRPEIARELAELANLLERLSEGAETAICVGLTPVVTPWRMGWRNELAAHARQVADAYAGIGSADELRYVVGSTNRRNVQASVRRSVIGALALAWWWYCTEADPRDRVVRAYKIVRDGRYTWAGNRGADFVREGTGLVTGKAPDYQTIAKALTGDKKRTGSAWSEIRKHAYPVT